MATEWDELLQVIQSMADTFELDRLLPVITRATRTLLDCESAHIYLREPGEQEYSLRTVRSLLLKVDASKNPALNELLLPLRSQSGEQFGILQALKAQGKGFNELERKRAALLAGLVAIAIKRQLLWNDARDKARLEREMRRAHDMVATLIPVEPLRHAGYEVFGRLVPASLTGGDLYDAFPLADERLAFFLADATGHGIDSTLLVAECRATIRSLFTSFSNPARVMNQANQLLCGPLGREERFVTLFLGVVDCRRHRLTYVNAGQSPATLRRANGHLSVLPPTGLPLGVDVGSAFQTRRLRMNPGDTILLATDGLIEWHGPGERYASHSMYGEDRLDSFLHQASARSARELVDAIIADVEAFAEKATNHDDVALLALRRCD